jgi:hypothetical protein
VSMELISLSRFINQFGEEKFTFVLSVTLTTIGRNRYKLLAYLRKRKDIEIVKLETRYMKNRDKGMGLRVTVRRLSE